MQARSGYNPTILIGGSGGEFIVDDVIYCPCCWLVLPPLAEGVVRSLCSCQTEAPKRCDACPCPTKHMPCSVCWPERAARHRAIMATLNALLHALNPSLEEEEY